MITLQQLQAMCDTKDGKARCAVFAPIFDELLPKSSINTPKRAAMFLAQALHESGEFRWLRELGNDKYLEKYDTGPIAKRLGNTPEDDGDGQLYRGRGIFQVTGKSNYRMCGIRLQLPLLEHPELLENPRHAVASAIWYWDSRNLNRHADLGALTACTIGINGGTNGIDERRRYYTKAKLALGIGS
jgi:putative chitinase